jgi:ribose-phosphate pyrophosphokinase
MYEGRMMVFAGNAHPHLARAIADHLQLPLGQAVVSRFSDGEVMVELMENVRGKDVFIVQPTCAPTNDNIMELLVMADALRRSSAVRVTAVVPYFGYSRQDRRPRSARVPISAKVVANMITSVGVDRVLTLDLHADQIQGFFDLPVDNIYRHAYRPQRHPRPESRRFDGGLPGCGRRGSRPRFGETAG